MTQPVQNSHGGGLVVIYAAKSTQDKHGSIPTQIEDCRRMAEREGWTVAGEYTDEAKSAYHGDRGPGLVAAREHAAKLAAGHQGCILVAQHSDRFARGDGLQATHLVEMWFAVRRDGIELRTVQDDSTFTNPLLIMALGERNTEDSRRKGAAVKAGMRRSAERGQVHGGQRPLGYRWQAPADDAVGSGRTLAITEAEARTVRRIYHDYLNGRRQRAIARDLNDEGLSTANGGRWYQGTVRNVLTNPLYKGEVTFDGETFPGHHEPIIDLDTWERTRQQREAQAASRGGGRGRTPRGGHLFTGGMLRCGCGSTMSTVTRPNRAEGSWYEVYACFRRLHDGQEACSQKPIKRDLIDSAVWRYFERVALDRDATRAAITAQADRKLAEHHALEHEALHELARVESALARIEGDYMDGKISAEQWARLEAKLTEQIDAARSQVEQHQRQRDALSAALADVDAEAVLLDELDTIRRLVAGEAQTGSRAGLDSFRAALLRLFTCFEIQRPDQPFGTGHRHAGRMWVPPIPNGPEGPPADWEPMDHGLSFGEGYLLQPHVRPEAIARRPGLPHSDGYPALHRAALALSVGNEADILTR